MSDWSWRLPTRRSVVAALGGTWGLALLQGTIRGWPGSVAVGLAATAGILGNHLRERGRGR
jgi:hypothetical protein